MENVLAFPRLGRSWQGVTDVKRINQYEFYQLGHELHPLLAVGASPTVSETLAFIPLTHGIDLQNRVVHTHCPRVVGESDLWRRILS